MIQKRVMKNLFFSMALFLSCQLTNAQLVVYSGYNLQGTTANCIVDTIYTNNNIPNGLNNAIKSISLNQGFMATFAENGDGTGERFTYMANKTNINVNLAMVLQNKISFIRVIKLPSLVIKKKGSANQDNTYHADLNATWFYDWGPYDNSTSTVNYVPMTWSTQHTTQAIYNAIIAKDSLTHISTFNEPDHEGQAGLFVSEAIPHYKDILRIGQRMGSPACTESQYRVWLDSFTTVANRDSLRIDYVCDHWYDWGNWLSTGNANPSATDVFNRFKTYVNNLYDYYKKPIWITEFNANVNRSPAVHEAFMALALPWLDANPNVERYAYFFGNDYPVYSSPGVLSTGGQIYANHTSVNAYPENIIDTRAAFPDTLAAWNPSTFTQGGRSVATFAPTTLDANMTAPLALTRGSGLSVPATDASNGYWGATGWSATTAAAGISANDFLTFSLKSTNGKSVNYHSIDKLNIRINSIGPIQYQIDYKLDNGSYRPCATLAGPTRTTGNYSLGPIDLSDISGLQDVSSSSTVTFRITPFDASSSTGTFLIGSGTGDTNPDLMILGGYTDENTITPTATNADLSALSLSSGSLSPTFAAATTSYTATVASGTSSITITPTKADANALIEVRVNGGSYASVTSGSVSSALNLNVGNNTIEVKVTAQDGTTIKTYTVTAIRPSTNADLSALTLSSGTLNPVFAAATTSYTATVAGGTSSITVTPTRANDNAKIEVSVNSSSYTEVSSGSASSSQSLNVGSNTVDVRVTAQDGTTIKTYTVTVTRPSTNADLSALTISSGTLTPSFAAATTSYTDTVANNVASITVTPIKAEVNATIQVRVNSGSYTTVNSGSASGALTISNISPTNNTVNVRVTAQDGTTLKTYTITVTKLSANANLTALSLSTGTLSPTFSQTTTAYTTSVTNATNTITITPTSASTIATIQVRVNAGAYTTVERSTASDALNLNVGSNIIDVLVTAQDGTTKTYSITVTRAQSSNADLSSLTISSGALSPIFAAATTAYTASVSNNTTTLTVTPTRAEANATIQVRVNSGTYTSVTSGAASSSLSLSNIGSNPIDVRVTAQDGTVKTYTITVTRLSANADLSGLTISSGTLSPTFTTATTSYTASVTNATTSITVTPTSLSLVATTEVRVNGGSYATVTRATASSALSLNVGSNTVNVRVTSQDGLVTKTYTITVTRAINTWIGGSSTDFSNPANWSGNAVPTVVDNFIVASSANNPLITGIQSAYNVTINSGAILNVTGTLKIAGVVTNNGTINATEGTIEYNGASAQTIAANTFASNTVQNLTVNNIVGVTLAGPLTVSGTVTPTSGVLTTGGNLTLASSALNTASIAAGTGTYISGSVNVQRYTRAQRGFRILGHPFNTAQNLGILTDNFRITGLTTNPGSGIYATSSGNPSAFLYDPTQNANTKDVLTKITDATANIWAVGKGLYLFVRGAGNEGMDGAGATNYSGGHSPLVIDGAGNINQGSVTVNLSYGGIGKDNYNLIGNPYACPINLKNVTGISSFGTVYVYNPIKNLAAADQYTVSGGFDQYTNNGSNNIIVPVYGAFFVKATANGQSITFNETDKVVNGSPTYTVFGTERQPKLRLEVANANGKLDEVTIGLDNNTSDASTDKYDAAKLDNSLFNFYSISSDNKILAIDYRANLNNVIPLGLQTDLASKYTISLIELTDLTNTQLVLRDKFLKTETILSQVGDGYTFSISADTATKGENRFEIGLLGTTVLPVQIADITAQLQANKTVAVSWTSTTEVNLAKYNVQRSKDGSNFTTIGTVAAKGASAYNYTDDLSPVGVLPSIIYYRLEAVDKDGSKGYSKVVSCQLPVAVKSISIYPNPVQAILFAQVTVTKAGAAQISVIDAQGKVVATQKTQLSVGTTSVSIPAAHLAAGSYVLEIDSADGKQTQRFVKE